MLKKELPTTRIIEIGLKSALQLLADRDLRWAEKLFTNMVIKKASTREIYLNVDFLKQRALTQIPKLNKYASLLHTKNFVIF